MVNQKGNGAILGRLLEENIILTGNGSRKQEILGKNRVNQGINPGIFGTLAAERRKQKGQEITRI